MSRENLIREAKRLDFSKLKIGAVIEKPIVKTKKKMAKYTPWHADDKCDPNMLEMVKRQVQFLETGKL